VPGSSTPRSKRERDAERQRAEAEAMRAGYARAARRRAAVGIGVVATVIIAVIVVVYVATSSEKSVVSTSTTKAPTTLAADTVPLPTVAPGQTIEGAAPCPATDGSSPRTTEFAQPPPMCLDPTRTYSLAIETSAGTIRGSLDQGTYPGAANSFAFLAGYHYYDGLPFSRIEPGAYATVGNPPGPDGQPGPGFTIPNEAAAKGPVLSPLMIALVPNADGTVGGSFLIGLAGQFASIPPNAPQIGMILDDRVDPNQDEPDPNVRQVINRAATASGSPSQVITINRVVISVR
jgi:cyclophilin family peptidyl-prolyl cis-trans isomerase